MVGQLPDAQASTISRQTRIRSGGSRTPSLPLDGAELSVLQRQKAGRTRFQGSGDSGLTVRSGGQPRALSARLGAVDDSRLTEVEVRYTYLERIVEDLSQVLHDQQRVIDTLTARIQRLEAVIAEAMKESPDRLPHEKPPHY